MHNTVKITTITYRSFTYIMPELNQFLNKRGFLFTIKYKLFQIGCCKNKSSLSLLNGKMVLDSLNEQNTSL